MFRKSGRCFMSTNYQVKFPACNKMKYQIRLLLLPQLSEYRVEMK
jgi:hypothetical protein